MARFPLSAGQLFRRYDETPDEEFYVAPRLVTHIDDHAIAAVTQLYRDYFPPGGAILDLMSSWVSHLPSNVSYRRVVGLGMNATELAANPRLHEWLIHNLNREPHLPYGEGEFDGAAICVSIQYLVQPSAVLADVGRVLKIGAPLVISFSNRCFPTKAVAVWQMLDDTGHMQLVERYFRAAGNWSNVEVVDRGPTILGADPLYAVVGRSLGPVAEGPEDTQDPGAPVRT